MFSTNGNDFQDTRNPETNIGFGIYSGQTYPL